jgi:multidrug efflux pump subunit AcrA (membrane-fusion protein)
MSVEESYETETHEARDGERGVWGQGPRSSGRGKLIFGLIFLLLVASAVIYKGVFARVRAAEAVRADTQELAVPSVSLVQPKRGAPQQEIILPGNIQAFIDAPIYARTNGYLKSWYVDIGGKVKSGQILAEIETPELDQQLQQARAELATAKANASLAQTTAVRYQDLLKSDSVAKQDVDNAVSDYQAKKAMVDSATDNVKRLEQLQS